MSSYTAYAFPDGELTNGPCVDGQAWVKSGEVYVPGSTTLIAHGSDHHTGTIGTESQIAFDKTSGHDHDGIDSKAVSYLTLLNVPATFPPSSHNHDGSYSPLGHDHDGTYAALVHNHDGTYSLVGHTHSAVGTDTQITYNDGGTSAGADGLTWDKTKKQLEIDGGTTDPALVVSGGQAIEYGTELLTNPAFDPEGGGWELGAGAEYQATGGLWLYNGVVSTVEVSAGGTGYQVGDVLSLGADTWGNDSAGTSAISAGYTVFTDGDGRLPNGAVIDSIALYSTASSGTIKVKSLAMNANEEGNGSNATVVATNIETFTKTSSGSQTFVFTTPWTVPSTGDYYLGAYVSVAQGNGLKSTAGQSARYYVGDASGSVSFGDALNLRVQIKANFASFGDRATVTVETLSGSAVATVSITYASSKYLTGVIATTGGNGTGCEIDITAVTTGSFTQDISGLTVGETYYCEIVFHNDNIGSMLGSTPNYTIEASIPGGAHPYWAVAVIATSGTFSFHMYDGNLLTTITKITSISYKRVTQLAGDIYQLYGSDAEPLMRIRNLPGSSDSLIWGADTANKLACATNVIIIGNHALKEAITAYETVCIGNEALDGNQGLNGAGCHTCVGYRAGKGTTAFQHTAFGWQALYTENDESYCTAFGAGAGMDSSGGLSNFFGFYAGHNSHGDGNMFVGTSAGDGLTIDSCMIWAPGQTGEPFFYGIHDETGTTGYCNLRGDWQPTITDTFDMGSAALTWNKVFTNQLNLGTLPANGIKTGTAAPTTGAHLVGEVVINSAPASEGVFAWVCTTAGTPGSWAPLTLGAAA